MLGGRNAFILTALFKGSEWLEVTSACFPPVIYTFNFSPS